jgi:hypothetical protein
MSILDIRIEKHRAAYDAFHQAGCRDGFPKPDPTCDAEDSTFDELVATDCESDAEFIKKLRALLTREVRIWGWPEHGELYSSIVNAVAMHLALKTDERGA